MGTTVATNALLERKGERTLLLITQRLSRRAARSATRRGRRSLRAQIVKPEMLYERVVEVDERVRADGTVERAPDLAAVRARSRSARMRDGIDAVAIVFMHAYRYPGARAAGGRARARDGLCAGLGQPRGLAADQARRPRRHHGGRRLSVADPARAMSAQVGARCSTLERIRARAPDVHDVVGRADRGRAVPGQGRDPVRARPAAWSAWRETGRAGRLRAPHRLRHGRHLDRRVAFRRRIRARLRDRGRRRAHARADDADPHRRGRRRLDPALSTARASASARIRPAPIPARPATAAAGRSR